MKQNQVDTAEHCGTASQVPHNGSRFSSSFASPQLYPWFFHARGCSA